MKVINIHSREYPVTSAEVGRLVDTLSSENRLTRQINSDSINIGYAPLGAAGYLLRYANYLKNLYLCTTRVEIFSY
jgi:hypothetical protein